MPKFSLYEIDQLLLDAIEAQEREAEANEGVYSETWDKFIDEIQMERTKKLLDCARYVKTLEAMAEGVKLEKMALQKRQAAYEAKAERIRNYVARSTSGGEKIKDDNTIISWRKAPASVEIVDIKLLPEIYTFTEIIPDKRAIKDGLKEHEIPGARMSDEKFTLSIK